MALKKRNKKRKIKNIVKQIFASVLFIFGITFIVIGVSSMVLLSSKIYTIDNENSYLDTSIKEEALIATYRDIYNKDLSPVFYNDHEEAFINAKYFPTSFNGKLTHYGPDCKLCGGTLGCTRKNVKKGQIYHDDPEYGTIRIVATTKSIPCGSILRIHAKAYGENGIIAIVLDRGVSGRIIDLLKVSEKSAAPSGTINNVKIDILRYGY